MHILFLTHYFPPEVNAPATRTFEHASRWAALGHEVTVVTCAPNCPDGVLFPGYNNRLRAQAELVDGIRVIRVWTYLAPNAGTTRRILNYLSFMISATLACLRLSRPDVVIATSPQLFCGWAGIFVSRLKRAPLVLEIRDIWPESIQAVGAIRKPWLLRGLEHLERWMYRAADKIVAVGNGYRDNILAKVAPRREIAVITNGVDLKRFTPREADLRFLHRWDLEDRFVCSYVGTIGMAHGLEVVLEAAKILKAKGRSDICFVLVGDGASRDRLQAEASKAGLDRMVVFTGKQPREVMPDILSSCDACLVHLKGTELFGTVIPSKIFETMAMGRPIIMGVRGEAQEIVMRAGAGIPMEPDSAPSLVDAVEKLADDPELTSRLSNAGRDFVAGHYDRDVLAARYLLVLAEIAGIELSRGVEAGRPESEEGISEAKSSVA